MAATLESKLQQSPDVGSVGGGWQLAPGQALSLYPRTDGLLRITRGRAWATLDLRAPGHRSEAGDHFLQAGEHLVVRAGRHLVFESLDPAVVCFEWVPSLAIEALPVAARELQLSQAWADVGLAAGQTGRALLRLLGGLLGSLPWLLGTGVRLRRRRGRA
jgi:Protein of unknown function (DUF2917)